MPWIVIVFGIAVGPLGVTSVLLVIATAAADMRRGGGWRPPPRCRAGSPAQAYRVSSRSTRPMGRRSAWRPDMAHRATRTVTTPNTQALVAPSDTSV